MSWERDSLTHIHTLRMNDDKVYTEHSHMKFNQNGENEPHSATHSHWIRRNEWCMHMCRYIQHTKDHTKRQPNVPKQCTSPQFCHFDRCWPVVIELHGEHHNQQCLQRKQHRMNNFAARFIDLVCFHCAREARQGKANTHLQSNTRG